MVGSIAISLGVLFFIINIIIGYDIVTNIILMIGIVTSNIPEGLLITLTVTLAIAARRMAAKKVLVKNMQSVETLGSTSCICSDKTGTLTQNRMTVAHLFYNNNIFDASTNFEEYLKNPNKERTYNVEDPGFQELINSIALGTKATFSYNPTLEEMRTYLEKKDGKKTSAYADLVLTDQQKREASEALIRAETNKPVLFRKTAGDASESGLIKFCHPILDINEARAQHPVFSYIAADGNQTEALIPFSSEIKFNLFIRDMNPTNKRPTNAQENLTVFMKGAPERILSRCSKILIQGEVRDFDEAMQKEVNAANEAFGAMGERVLAFARYELDTDFFTKEPAYPFDVKNWKNWKEKKEFDPSIKGWFPMFNLTLVGLVALNDPPRVGVPRAVSLCK